MNAHRVRRLDPETEIEAMRAIRLEALRHHPEAFCADLKAEEAMTLAQWRARAATGVSFGAFKDDALAGIAVFTRPDRPKLAHTGDLSAMYVRAEYRSIGLADALIEAVIDHAIGLVEQIKLGVNAENPGAMALYERHGFRTVGRIPRAFRVDGKTYDEILMMRTVSASD